MHLQLWSLDMHSLSKVGALVEMFGAVQHSIVGKHYQPTPTPYIRLHSKIAFV